MLYRRRGHCFADLPAGVCDPVGSPIGDHPARLKASSRGEREIRAIAGEAETSELRENCKD